MTPLLFALDQNFSPTIVAAFRSGQASEDASYITGEALAPTCGKIAAA